MKAPRTHLSARVADEQDASWRAYGRRVVGRRGLGAIVKYDLVVGLLGGVAGGLGLWLRSRLYPLVMGEMTRSSYLASHVVLRHPHAIRLGERTFVDSFAVLDGVTDQAGGGLVIGPGTYIHMYCVVSAGYHGYVRIGRDCSVNQGTQIYGTGGVEIGDHVLIGGMTSIVAYSHTFEDPGRLIRQQPITSRGVQIADDVWIGANATILDGVTVGQGAVIGAGSVVTHDVAAGTVVAGVPARLLRERGRPRRPTD